MQQSLYSQFHIPTGARVSTPAGTGTLEHVADVYKRGTTEIESVDALVFVDGKGRQTFDVRQITAAPRAAGFAFIPVSGGAIKLSGGIR